MNRVTGEKQDSQRTEPGSGFPQGFCSHLVQTTGVLWSTTYWSFAEEAQCHIFIYSAMPSSVITLLLNSQSIGIILVDDLGYSPAHASFMRDLDYMDVILLPSSFPGSSLIARTNAKKEK